jgi:hypothetical protein
MEINKTIEEQSTKEIEKAILGDQNAIPYTPMSKLPALGVMMPLKLSGETLQAQFSFQEEIGDVDQYLIEKLNYTSKFAMSKGVGVEGGLAAEQADAIAMTIKQIEKGKGLILADMAGVGKGRVNASILRYAFLNGYLPIFITEKPNLFSAIYRDITDIGGVQTKSGGVPFNGKPLILNGYKSGGFDKTFDEQGKRVRIKKPSETGIIKDGKEIITAPKQEEIKQIVDGSTLPKGYDYLFLTFSQISGKTRTKIDFLLRLAEKKKIIVCIDECHNAAGTTSTVGKRMKELVEASQGVLFSSATFSKRPDNMFLYALKTDIIESPLGTDDLINVIKKGGERLTENLASNLVVSQQMLRRERSYENCDVQYEYMKDDQKETLYKKYDNVLKLYLRLREYFSIKNSAFKIARENSIERFVKEKKIKVAEEPKPENDILLLDWQKKYQGQYYLKQYSVGDVKRNQFQLIETLLFAIKAEFVSQQAINQLTNKFENIRVEDKVKFESNRKPVIAVRNTLEGVYFNLGLEVGSEIDNADFSQYLYALAVDAIEGVITFQEIKIGADDDEKGKKIKEDLLLENSDFEDGGVSYKQLLDDIKNVDLDIPLSPIDYIIQRIENTPRPSWDMENGGGTRYFKVGEVTGRKFTLLKQKNGKYQLELNKKDKNKASTFQKFNSGEYDVLLINESGSTGEDAHSSSKFKDQRPRVMIIHQVELDVNTEVQKRGRINRTGMVNYPTYVYAISRIPSEIRRLLMLVRKLRSLDANTTGNQKQSQKLSTIRDSQGNEIEDVINQYGDECLEEFLSTPGNEEYLQYSREEKSRNFDEFEIQAFIRKLELAFCEQQEKFFNVINALYTKLKEDKGGKFDDLETNLVDLKAVIKTRIQKSKGKDTSPFNSSVYIEDDYVLAQDKPYTKEKVEELVYTLSENQDPTEFYKKFIEDYKKYSEEHINEIVDSIPIPDYDSVKDKEQKKLMKEEYEAKKLHIIEKATKDYQTTLMYINPKKVKTKNNTKVYKEADENQPIPKTLYYETEDFVSEKIKNSQGTWYLITEGWIKSSDVESEEDIFYPNSPVLIPTSIDECYETDAEGEPIKINNFNIGRFCGIKLLKTAKEKYSPMNIELIFCQLSGKPKLLLKPTTRGRVVLDWILFKSVYIEKTRRILIDNWEVDLNRRELVRMLTGNILGAYSIALDIVKSQPYSPIIKFLKFTTADNTSIRLGLQITPEKFYPLVPEDVEIEYPLNSKDLVPDFVNSKDYIKSLNANQNFSLEKGWNGMTNLRIFGGKASTPPSTKKRKYYNSLFDDGELMNFLENNGYGFYKNDTYKFRPLGQNSISVRCTNVYFNYIISDLEKQTKLKNLFDFIYSKDPFNIKLTGIESPETIYLTEEEVKEQARQFEDVDKEDEKEGEFRYDLVNPYSMEKQKIETFSKFLKYVRTSDYGTIYTKRRAKVREAISYGLIPLDSTIQDMVVDTFDVIGNDTEKLKLKELLNKAIEEGKNSYEIGKIVKDAIKGKIISFDTIFGYNGNDTEFIGDVFIKYSKGEIELPKGKVDEEKRERVMKPLTMESAEEYLMNFYFKTKK